MTQDEQKRAAALAAIEELPERGIIGLGSGSTIAPFLEAVAALVKSGRELSGVATSEGTRTRALALGIPVLDDDGPWDIAVCVDGADEVDANNDLIKGGGAAHTREKIVNAAARRNVIIVDSSKLSAQLGEKWPVPVEVVSFGHRSTAHHLAAFGTPVLREKNGAVVRTDAGNPIYDVRTGPLIDAAKTASAMRAIPGVIEIGLFIRRADLVIVASETGVRKIPSA